MNRTVVLACAALFACSPSVKQTLKAGDTMSPAIIEPYLKIQTDLASDRIDGVKAQAGNIISAAAALGAPAMKIDGAAMQLAAAADLPDARTKFGLLSDAIVNYMGGLHLVAPAGVREAYCPMVKKPWLQQGSVLANPYYGSAMPTCGEFR